MGCACVPVGILFVLGRVHARIIGSQHTPAYAAVNNGSAATFTPTCFIVDSTRAPATDAPMPTSTATFSLTHHSAYTPSFFANASSVSVDGVPG